MPADIKLTTEVSLDGAIRDINRLPSLVKPIPLKFDTGGLALGKITGQVSEFQKSLAASNARVLAFAASAGQLYTYVRVFDNILRSTIEVQKSLTNLNVIFGLSSKQLDLFATNLFKVANETGQSFKTASDAALEFSRQGLGVEETLKRTKDALTLTRLTGLDTAESIRTLTTAINGFNQAGLDSTTILNKLTSVDTSFAISAGDIAEALTRVGSIAKDTGVSFDKLLGLITSARVITGREGSVIATSLGTIFQRIERPQVLNQLRDLKVVVEDVNGETLSADKILQNLAKTYGTLDQAQKNQIIQFAGGVRQGNVLRALMADLAKENSVYEKVTLASANATDVARQRQEALNKTLSAQINETVNNFTQAAYKIGTITLTPSITRVLGAGNLLSGSFNKELGTQAEQSGQFLGEGVLRGIGNYLSGPGLALGAAVITKFFTNFIGFATKSLTQLLEVGSTRYQNEQAIEAVLQREPGLMAELNRLGTDNAAIQVRITQELEKQLALQNQRATAINAVYSQTASNAQYRFGLADDKAFRINSKGELGINRGFGGESASGFIPSIKETLGALKGGYNPGKIKDINISGVGKVTYNSAEQIKNFAGFSQPAILPPQHSKAGQNYKKTFQSYHGFNPYSAEGLVPGPSKMEEFLKLFKKEAHPNIDFRLDKLRPDEAYLANFEALTKGQGHGSDFMKALTSNADKHKINLSLTPSAYGKGGMSQENLIKFYEKFGFSESASINGDLAEMFRKHAAGGFMPTAAEGGLPYPYNLLPSSLVPEQYKNPPQAFNPASLAPDIVRYGPSVKPEVPPSPKLLTYSGGKNPIQLPEFSQSTQLSGQIETYKNLIQSGFAGQKNLNKAVEDLAEEFDLTSKATKNIKNSFQNSAKPNYISDASRLLEAPGTSTARSEARIQELVGRFDRISQRPQRSALLDENGEKRRVLLTPPPNDFLNSLRNIFSSGGYEASLSNLGLRSNNLGNRPFSSSRGIGFNRPNLDILNTSEFYSAIQKNEAAQLAELQKSFGSKLNDFNLLGLLNPIKYKNLENDAIKTKQLGSFRNRVSELQNSAFLASFIAPVIGGIAEQGIQQNFGNTANGRGYSRLAGATGNIASFALTGAGIGGPYGALAGAGIGAVTEIPSVIKAFTDTLPDLQRRLEELKDSTLRVTTAVSNFAQANEHLRSIESGEENATNGQVKTLQSQRNLALSQLPQNIREQVSQLSKQGEFDKINELLSNFAGFTKQQQGAQENLVVLKQLIESNKEPGLVSGFGQAVSNRYKIFGGGTGFLGDIIGGLNVINPLGAFVGTRTTLQSNLDVERKQREIDLDKKTRPYLENILGFQNEKGETLLQNLQPRDIGLVRNASTFEDKVGALGTVLGGKGTLGSYLPTFINDLKETFKTPESQNLFNKDINKIFDLDYINNLINSGKDVNTGIEKTNKLFSDFTNKLEEFQGQVDKFIFSVETSGVSGFTATRLRSSEIVQNTSNQLALARGGNNPFVANQFQFQEQNQKINNETQIKSQELSDNTRNQLASALAGVFNTGEKGGSLVSQIQQKVFSKKESGNISAEDEKEGEDQLKVLSDLFNNPQYTEIKQRLQNPQNLSLQDVSKISDFVGNQLKILDQLRQSSETSEEQIKKLAPQLGITPQQLTDIFTQRTDFFNAVEKSYQDVQKTISTFNKGNIDISNSKFQQLALSNVQFEQNKRLISPSISLSSDQQKLLANQNEANARQGNFNQINLGQTFASGFDYNRNQFWADTSKNVQEFGKEFKDAFTGAFAEAENSSKKFTDILRDKFLSLAQNLTTKFVGQGIDSLFGSTIGQFAPVFTDLFGSSAAHLSNGGFVGMGSGTKDDVPAMLTGGEYVLTKNAVQSIGIDNLDKLNDSNSNTGTQISNSLISNGAKIGGRLLQGDNSSGGKSNLDIQALSAIKNEAALLFNQKGGGGKISSFADGGVKQPSEFGYKYGKKNPTTYPAATLADSISTTGTSASINLANAYLLSSKGSPYRKGSFDVSSLLSTYGQTEGSNPQNQLKANREKFVVGTDIKNKKIANERSAFNTNQDITLGAAIVSSGVKAYSGFSGGTSLTPGQSYDLSAGQGPVSAEFANSPSSLYENTSIINDNFPSTSPYLNSVAPVNFQARGGIIRKMATGGVFGGDTPSDNSPAMLMGGEYVMKPSTVSKYGVNYFNNLNKRYAAGGYVGSSSGDNSNDMVSDYLSKLVEINQEISTKLGTSSNTNIPAQNSKAATSNPNGASNSNSQSSGITNNVTVNITMSSTSSGSTTTNGNSNSTSSSSSQSDKDTAKQLGDLVNSQMTTLLINQSKSGGILWERFQPRQR